MLAKFFKIHVKEGKKLEDCVSDLRETLLEGLLIKRGREGEAHCIDLERMPLLWPMILYEKMNKKKNK